MCWAGRSSTREGVRAGAVAGGGSGGVCGQHSRAPPSGAPGLGGRPGILRQLFGAVLPAVSHGCQLLWEILGRSSSSDKGLPHGAGRPSHAVGTPFFEAVHSRRTRRNQRGGLPQHWGHRQQPCRWHPFTESSLWDWHRSEHSMSALSRKPPDNLC